MPETNTQMIRLTLELDDGSGPIAGRLYGHESEESRFSGYMELIAALEVARLAPPATEPHHPGEGGATDVAEGGR